MKNLKDILVEKLSIDSIVPDNEFPIDGTVEEMSNFLTEIGFEEIKMPSTWSGVQSKFLKSSYPIFTKYIHTHWNSSVIAIYNGTNKMHKDLFILDIDNSTKTYYIFYNLDTKNFVRTGDAKKVSKEQFLEEISNIL